jgi:DNA polymerase (family 10)
MDHIQPKQRLFSLEAASRVSDTIVNALRDVCEQIRVVGSIRRKKACVHDIDLVVVPLYKERETRSLFPEKRLTSLLDERLSQLASTRRILVKSNGEKMKCVEFREANVSIDIYIASRENWATLLLIRTGSREHNIYLCKLAQSLGMQLKADGSGLFRDGTVMAGDSEESIFFALGLDYVDPEAREILGWR